MSEQLDTAADAVIFVRFPRWPTKLSSKAVKDRLAAQTAGRIAATKRYSRRQIVARRFWRNKTAVSDWPDHHIVGGTFRFISGRLGLSPARPWPLLGRAGTEHWFGTDKRGRDMFAMTMEGLRKSLIIGFSVALIQTGWAAIFHGASAAYFGGWVDKFSTWFIDLMLVIPSFLMIAIISNRFRCKRRDTYLHPAASSIRVGSNFARGSLADHVCEEPGLRPCRKVHVGFPPYDHCAPYHLTIFPPCLSSTSRWASSAVLSGHRCPTSASALRPAGLPGIVDRRWPGFRPDSPVALPPAGISCSSSCSHR